MCVCVWIILSYIKFSSYYFLFHIFLSLYLLVIIIIIDDNNSNIISILDIFFIKLYSSRNERKNTRYNRNEWAFLFWIFTICRKHNIIYCFNINSLLDHRQWFQCKRNIWILSSNCKTGYFILKLQIYIHVSSEFDKLKTRLVLFLIIICLILINYFPSRLDYAIAISSLSVIASSLGIIFTWIAGLYFCVVRSSTSRKVIVSFMIAGTLLIGKEALVLVQRLRWRFNSYYYYLI